MNRTQKLGATISLTLIAVALLAAPAWALIKVLHPLQKVIAESNYIFVAKVESVDPSRPSAVLTHSENLKGEAPWKRLPINLKGNAIRVDGKEVLHSPDLLKRLAPDLPVIVFGVNQPQGKTMLLAYTNGTWFQVVGQKDGERQSWAFTHCEIYLRRTFHGPTADMQQVVADVLARKAKAPPPDETAIIGFGPEVPQP
jgi:hypothetical protein